MRIGLAMVLPLVLVLVAACTPPEDRFEAMMVTSRAGHDAQTLKVAAELLADPEVSPMTKARTEMTVALVHIRSKSGTEAQAALDRAKALGIESDSGYFKDHLAEYQGWAAALP